MINNPDASKGEKRAYAFELGSLLKDKYEDADLDVIRSFDMKNGNQFNIVREYNTVLNDVELFALGTLETNKRKQ
ncbi:MAG: hypothetical protein ACPHOG_05960, partial [Verrucomicrobiales bacterium]